jgi:hypothetical protein
MIFPDVPTDMWLAKYPFLKIISSTCDGCRHIRSTTKPFISKEYVGLESPRCECCKSNHSAMYMASICKKEIESWKNTLEGNS